MSAAPGHALKVLTMYVIGPLALAVQPVVTSTSGR